MRPGLRWIATGFLVALLLVVAAGAAAAAEQPVLGPTLTGPCEGRAIVAGYGVIDPATSGGRYVVPRAGSATYEAGIAQAEGDREVDGRLTLTLPPPLPPAVLGQWGPDGEETAASGDYTWDEELLPEAFVPAGIPFQVAGEHHDVSGDCEGSVELVIAGGFFDSPVGATSLGLSALALAGLVAAARGRPIAAVAEPCPEELAASQEADRACEEARAAAAEARAAAEEAEAARDGIREQLDEIRQEYPEAGSAAGDAYVESEGRRVTSADVRAGKAADRAAWKAYRDGEVSAEELVEKWGRRPEDVERFRELDDRAGTLEGGLRDAEAAADRARSAAEDAEARAERACREAAEARSRLERCRAGGQAAAADDTAAATGTAGGTTPGTTAAPGGTVAAPVGVPAGTGTRERDGCAGRPDEERNPREASIRVPVGLNTRLAGFVGHEQAERGRGIADDMATIGAALGWISTAMTLVPGRTLVHDPDGWKAFEIGATTAVGQTTGRMEATGNVSVPTPTNPIQAGVDTLSLFYTLGGKLVGAWSGFVERYDHDGELWISRTYAEMRLRCVEVWGCVDDRWVKKGDRFSVTKVREYKTGEKYFFPVNWPKAQEEIGRWAQRTDGELRQRLKEMDAFKERCGA